MSLDLKDDFTIFPFWHAPLLFGGQRKNSEI